MSLRYAVALDMWSGALEDMTLCLIWSMVVHIFFSHISQCSLFSFSHLSFPIQTFLSSAASSTTFQTIPHSPHLCPFALLQCLSQYKDHMRQQSREPKDIGERAVRVTTH